MGKRPWLVRATLAAWSLAALVAGPLRASATTAPAADASEEARILQLAKRATFGATPELQGEIRTLGRARWIAQQTAPETIPDPALAAKLAIYPALGMTSSELLASYPQTKGGDLPPGAIGRPGRIVAEVSAEVVTRAVHARAQLAEVMTDFWLDHFNVYALAGPTRYTCLSYLRDTIRPHALGRFRDLLLATAQSPAMLYYLDNDLSTSPTARTLRKTRGINENYARELLELHTVGVDGGYTQDDVDEVARILTGWTITPPRSGSIDFVYRPALHDGGTKTVLGQRFAPAGFAEGVELLDMLAREPATAEHIARQLASRFVADVPPESVVQRAKDVFLASDGDIARVVATILTSDELYAPENRGSKVKSPLEVVASTLRALHADVRVGVQASRRVGDLGQPILRALPPNGWQETADQVVSAGGMVGRFDLAYDAASGAIPGVRVDGARLARLARGPGGLDALVRDLLPGGVSSTTHAALEQARAAGATPALLAALVLSSPEFQQQ